MKRIDISIYVIIDKDDPGMIFIQLFIESII